MPATPLQQIVHEITGQVVLRQTPLSGGCLGHLLCLHLEDGSKIVAKHGDNLACEAWMLTHLGAHSTLTVPRVLHCDDDWLLMEYLDGKPHHLSPKAQQQLGAVIAELHESDATHFGLERDTVIGPLPQPNPRTADWPAFFRDQRLLFMAEKAERHGTLPAAERQRLDKLAARLDELLPHDRRPSLIHGDLWGGNILSDGERIVGFVDPAIYYADPEIELAFMTLFNTVDKAFFAAYRHHHPLERTFFTERRQLYLLYPLLVHLRLFGSGYLRQIDSILRHFGV